VIGEAAGVASYIRSDQLAENLRGRAVDVDRGLVRVAVLEGSAQEPDITLPPNCSGLGRIHHFRWQAWDDWPPDPLPMAPARRRLGLPGEGDVTAQVFQLAACNWRCWYCFVPFGLLAPTDQNSRWVTTDELVDMYLDIPGRPPIIDCSGGQPDLAPEWIPWMMRSLADRGLDQTTFLWSDDNLSNDYFWKFLDSSQRETVAAYRNYARVGCFKGFDPESFSFNTKASPDMFGQQFSLFERMFKLGIDLYAYSTFTGPNTADIQKKIIDFMDRLQAIHPNLPLRTVPLRIGEVGVLTSRGESATFRHANEVQLQAIDAWRAECDRRFSAAELSMDISLIEMRPS